MRSYLASAKRTRPTEQFDVERNEEEANKRKLKGISIAPEETKFLITSEWQRQLRLWIQRESYVQWQQWNGKTAEEKNLFRSLGAHYSSMAIESAEEGKKPLNSRSFGPIVRQPKFDVSRLSMYTKLWRNGHLIFSNDDRWNGNDSSSIIFNFWRFFPRSASPSLYTLCAHFFSYPSLKGSPNVHA